MWYALQVVFLFADTQIVQEGFIEDISNLLNTYEVPNLMQVCAIASKMLNVHCTSAYCVMADTY